MTRNLCFIVLIFIILLNSCIIEDNNITSVSFDDFGPVITLENPDTLIITSKLYRVQGITSFKNYIIVADEYDTICRAFSYPNCEYVGSAILKGRGPNELRGPGVQGFYSTFNGVTFQGFGGRVVLLDIIDDELLIKRMIQLPGEFFGSHNLFDLGDSTYFATAFIKPATGEFISYNFSNSELGSFSDYPVFLSDYPPNMQVFYSVGLVTIKKDQSRFARLYTRFPVLRIFNKDGSELSISKVEIPGLSMSFEYDADNDGIKYLFGGRIYSSDKFIFAETFMIESGNIVMFPQILIYDWDGKPVGRFNIKGFDDVPSYGPFMISEDHKYLYMVDEVSLNRIFRYRMSSLGLK